MTEQSYLDARATGGTTIALCWRIIRDDGETFGFTDHDRPLTLLGLTFEPSTALAASEMSNALGLSPDELEGTGALSSDGITESDIHKGLWDHARVEIYDVDWSDVSSYYLLGIFNLAEIERGPLAFRSELRSRTAALDRPKGRSYLNACDARFGDTRCGLDLTSATFKASGAVTGGSSTRVLAAGLTGYSEGHFNRGILTWTGGDNAGVQSEVRACNTANPAAVVSLWKAPPKAVSAGDTFDITAGCDKSYRTCRDRFGNQLNFRGCPHIPGEDWVVDYARTGDPSQDGGSYSDGQ